MTLLRHEKHPFRRTLGLIMIGLTFSPHASAQDGPSAIPEGSGSIIQPVSWRLTGENVATLTEQVHAVVQQFEGAVLVREEKNILVLSLPSAKLPALHRKLSALGTLTSPQAADGYQAPTTLLRLRLGSAFEGIGSIGTQQTLSFVRGNGHNRMVVAILTALFRTRSVS